MFTTQGAYLNDNNLLRVRSSRLAEDYTVEFEEMFVDDLFGPSSRTNTPYPSLTRAGSGIEVMGVFEETQYKSNIGTEYDRLREAGLEVRLDGNRRNMHHKVMIIDERILVTGSYNFSANAEDRNDENTLIIYSPEVASIYVEEFERVFALTSE
jgi:phosphatidylserine/phosphatidylglycerophosphate/cardiolipin synthase-like enzyme